MSIPPVADPTGAAAAAASQAASAAPPPPGQHFVEEGALASLPWPPPEPGASDASVAGKQFEQNL